MVPISLYDHVCIHARPTRGPATISCAVKGSVEAPMGEENIAWKAARAVLTALDLSARVDISIAKNIPTQAGLGGGSSDAAIVLRRLPGLLGRRISRGRVLELAASLGADVPFFVECRPAIARGIGELLEPLVGFPRMAMVVVVPPTGVNTAWAYRSALPAVCKRSIAKGRARPAALRAASLQLSRERLLSRLSNDFEPGVSRAVADVARVRDLLAGAGAQHTVMTGSGSAMVGLFPGLRQARAAASDFGRRDRAFAVTGLTAAPVHKSR